MHRLPSVILCLSIALLFFGGCNKPDQLASPETGIDQQEPSDPSAKTGGIADAIRGQSDMTGADEEAEDLPDDLPGLMSYVARKQVEQLRPRDAAESYRIQQQRSQAAARLLGMEIDNNQRFEFVRIRLDALLKLIGAGDPQAKLDFQAVISKYGKHRQPRIRQVVAIAGLTYDFRQIAAGEDPQMDRIVTAATQIIADYPDDFEVCREIGSIADQMLLRGHRQSWTELATKMVGQYNDSPNETCRNYAQRLASRLQVASAKLDLIVDEIRQQVPGALEKYRQAINYLFSDPGLNIASLQPVVDSLRWLENTGMKDETLEANRIVMAASLQIADTSAKDQLRAHCDKRKTRLEMIGNSFSIAAWSLRDAPLDWSGFSQDHSVIVIFWSPSEPASVKLVQKMASYYESYRDKGLKLLAVSLSNSADLPTSFGATLPEWEIVKSDSNLSGDPEQWIRRYGIERSTQLVFVDRLGVVTAVNPGVGQLESLLENLVP